MAESQNKRWREVVVTTRRKLQSWRYTRNAMHSDLWKWKRTPTIKGAAIGGLVMWLPVPAQTLIGAVICVYFRGNIPISLMLCLVSNPFTWIPMIGIAGMLGQSILPGCRGTEDITDCNAVELAFTFTTGAVFAGVLTSILCALAVWVYFDFYLPYRQRKIAEQQEN